MDDTITVEFTPEPADRAEAMLYAYQRDWPPLARFALAYSPTLLLALAIVLARAVGQVGTLQTITGIALAGLLAAAAPWLTRRFAAWFSSHTARKVVRRARLTFTAGGFSIHGDVGESRFSWNRVRDVVANGRATIIDLQEYGKCVIPARAFANFDEYSTFAGVVQTWHFEARGAGPPELLPL